MDRILDFVLANASWIVVVAVVLGMAAIAVVVVGGVFAYRIYTNAAKRNQERSEGSRRRTQERVRRYEQD